MHLTKKDKLHPRQVVAIKVGEKATLTIRPLGSNLTQNNVAILRIVVKTTDGRTIAVVKNDVLSGNSSYNNKEYTITHSK